MKHSANYDAGNSRAAAVILSNPLAYPEGLRQWAERWQASLPPKVRQRERPSAAAQEDARLALGFKQTTDGVR